VRAPASTPASATAIEGDDAERQSEDGDDDNDDDDDDDDDTDAVAAAIVWARWHDGKNMSDSNDDDKVIDKKGRMTLASSRKEESTAAVQLMRSGACMH
jgi:hypothetical protein